jgi:beta-lactamase regulating signal transducer with metallopeptidase domain
MPGSAAGLPGLMAGYLLKTTVVLIVALLGAAVAKRRPAAFRHFILSSALIGLLLLPLLTLAPVGWRSPLLPAWMAVSAPPAEDGPKVTATELPAGAPENGGEPGVRQAAAGSTLSRAWPVVRPLADAESRSLLPSPARLDPAVLPSGALTVAKTARTGVLSFLLAVLWAAGLAILLLRLAFGLSGAVRLTAEGTPLDDASWRVLLERFLAFVSLRREVRLRSHPGVLVPMTWGFRKPYVLFPDGADAWTEDERSSALYHELSHIKRADFLAMLLVRTSLALFWWNPLCWVVYREILKEQEIACDELVLRAGIRPSIYAASLLAFRRLAGFRWNPSAALLGMLGRSSFQERLAAILKHKLTLMEVKMKTKIMIVLALVAAVALIGTARPAVGIEKSAATTSVVEPAAPAPALLDAARTSPASQEVQAEKAVIREKQKEQEKAKAAEKAKEAEKAAKEKAVTAKTIVIKPVGEEGEPIEITITEGDTTRKLVLEKSLTITKDKDGKVLVLTPEGQEPIVLKGEPLRLEIKGGGLEVIKEGHLLKSGDGGDKTIFYFTPKGEAGAEGKTLRIVEKAEAGEAAPEVIVKRIKEIKPGEKWVAVEPGQEAQTVKIVKKGEAGTAWTIEEPEKGEAVWVAKEVPGRPILENRVAGGGMAFAFSAASGKEMLDKVQALEEQVQAVKAKKMDITVLEESLKKLEAELKAKQDKLKTFTYEFDKEPVEYVFSKRSSGDEAKSYSWVMENSKAVKDAKGAKAVIGIGEKEGEISLLFTGYDGEAGKAAFERAIAKLKQDLPEGYKLAEQKYDAENGVMTFKIATPEGKKMDETLVKKIVDSVNEAVKAAK